MSVVLLFSAGVDLEDFGDGRLIVRQAYREVPLEGLTPGLRKGLQRLGGNGLTQQALADQVLASDGAAGLPLLFYILQQLARLGFLSFQAVGERWPLATAKMISPHSTFRMREPDLNHSYVVSRFALLRRAGDEIVIESPLSSMQIAIHDARVGALFSALSTPRGLNELSTSGAGLAGSELREALTLLLTCGILTESDDRGRVVLEEEGTLSQWAFHELLFHARSRMGRHLGGYGGTYRFVDRCEPPAAIKPPMSDEVTDLYRPDLDLLSEAELPLTSALEGRRSLRSFGDPPLTVRHLGEFLYRTARVRRSFAGEHGLELGSRPYPSGGALYELEIYLNVGSCVDLPSGLYHYCPREHRLCKLPDRPESEALLRQAAFLTRQPVPPQVLVTISARFPRVFWKYESMGYALVLKDLGVLYQTMSLVAEAMGLAACALGGGDADLFAAATGTNYYEESSVGELVLGSRPSS
jgi:SagB-type dehydrogenase family enzyme